MAGEPTGEPFERLEAEEARGLFDAGGLTWIDVREPAEWARGRIPGARLVPLNQLLLAPRQHLEGLERVVFYCAQGIRSAVACEAAAAVGLQELYNLEGGTEEWGRRGFPLES